MGKNDLNIEVDEHSNIFSNGIWPLKSYKGWNLKQPQVLRGKERLIWMLLPQGKGGFWPHFNINILKLKKKKIPSESIFCWLTFRFFIQTRFSTRWTSGLVVMILKNLNRLNLAQLGNNFLEKIKLHNIYGPREDTSGNMSGSVLNIKNLWVSHYHF